MDNLWGCRLTLLKLEPLKGCSGTSSTQLEAYKSVSCTPSSEGVHPHSDTRILPVMRDQMRDACFDIRFPPSVL